ncbi:kinesin-like protein KIP3 [Cyclospora cayetanensis]|uniref:Kinesin-like protein KIP3 n=1 Tax=Cyclospora cayetanensis TaxID=88456 RepID=A0A6P6S068_9EIME|nr:kinesin-like protein KIP3 [Cyclospora cayetanensis]
MASLTGSGAPLGFAEALHAADAPFDAKRACGGSTSDTLLAGDAASARGETAVLADTVASKRARPACGFPAMGYTLQRPAGFSSASRGSIQTGVPIIYLSSQKGWRQEFMFDRVFGPEATQDEVYFHSARKIIPHVLAGLNGTVFAYGATGAGKTYTMQGSSEQPGIISRAIRVQNLSLHPVSCAEEALRLLDLGNKNRNTAATAANLSSSRSHAIFQEFQVDALAKGLSRGPVPRRDDCKRSS